MLRLLIIDDEARARQYLRALLSAYADVEIVGEASSVSEALILIQSEKPDALLLDIEMPGENGFTLLRALDHPPRVVIVTAYACHAVEAFECQAVDYLLKPVKADRLATTLKRLRTQTPSESPWQAKDRICFKTPQRTVIAESKSILALEADGDFSRIYIEGETPVMICHNLSYYEKVLPSPPFLRLDRSLLINKERVKSIEPMGNDQANLTLSGLEKPFVLGRTAHRRLSEALKEDAQ